MAILDLARDTERDFMSADEAAAGGLAARLRVYSPARAGRPR